MKKKSQDIRQTFEKKYLFDEFQLYVNGENRVLDKVNKPYTVRHKYFAKALKLAEFFFNGDLLHEEFYIDERDNTEHSRKLKERRKSFNHKNRETNYPQDGISAKDLKVIFGGDSNHVISDFRNIFGNDSIPLEGGFYRWDKANDFRIEHNPKEMLVKKLSDYEIPSFIESNIGYVSEITKLKRKDEIDEHIEKSDSWQDREFFVALAKITLSRSEDENQNKIISAKVFLPKNPFVAFENKSGNRNRMERYPNAKDEVHPFASQFDKFNKGEINYVSPFLARFSAGGSLTILNVPTEESYKYANGDESKFEYEEFIFVAQKDRGANIHRYHLVPSSGIAEYEKDFTNPLLVAAGECAEEIHLRDKDNDGIWYRPNFKPESFNDEKNEKYRKYLHDLNIRIEGTVEKRREYFLNYLRSPKQKTKRPNLPYSNHYDPSNEYKDIIGIPRYVDAQFYQLGEDELLIDGVSDPFKGLLVLDKKYGAVDLMTTIILTIEKPLSKLLTLDGESLGKELLWRNSFVFKPHELHKIFNGNKSQPKAEALFFGSLEEDSEWLNGVTVRILSEEIDINPPLLISGEALLRKRYGLEVTTPYKQQNKQQPFELEILNNTKDYEN